MAQPRADVLEHFALIVARQRIERIEVEQELTHLRDAHAKFATLGVVPTVYV